MAITLFRHQWKIMLAVISISLLSAFAYTWIKTPEYLSVATALPSSAYANDRSKLFNENIQLLYSDLGTADELDVITGSGQLDTVYLAVTDQFNLFDHYRIKKAELLKKNTRVIKSGNGELKVSVWDMDKDLAPQLANAIMAQLQKIHTEARNAGNEHMIQRLRQSLDSVMRSDSLKPEGSKVNEEKIATLRKLISEYELIGATKTPALVIIENARAAFRPDKPKCLQIWVAAFLFSFLLSVLLAIYRERIKSV
jgi:uncharacterized protein involved in exopolysaccharide biosynthesis